MNKKKSTRIKLGDVYSIPLPNGKYAFGRRFKDASIAIYSHIGETIEDLPGTEDYQFTVGVYKDVLTSGRWHKVANRPFKSPDEEWPPAMCVVDKLVSGKYQIYHRGQLRNASKSECEGLEIAAV